MPVIRKPMDAASISIAVFLLLIVPAVNGDADYYYSSLSFDCSVYEGGDTLFVAQSATLYCFQGSVNAVNITLPYDSTQTVDLEETLTVQTVDGDEIGWRVSRPVNRTVITVALPQRLYPGEEEVIVAKYSLRGIAESRGATLVDHLFGRRGPNTAVSFRTPVFEAAVSELIVRIYPPAGRNPKDWDPRTDSAKTWRADGKLGIIWHRTSDIPDRPEFELVFGEGGWNISFLDMLGITIVALFIFLHHRRRAKGGKER